MSGLLNGLDMPTLPPSVAGRIPLAGLSACARASLLWLSLLVLSPRLAPADVLVLKDGKRVEGDVTEQADAYEVKTKYGILTIRKDEVSRVVDVKRLMRDGDSYRSGVRALLEEVQKEGIKPDDRKTKLAMMSETVRKALEIYREARSVSSGDMAADLDQRIEEMTKAEAVCQTVPDTLDPVAPPKDPSADPAKAPAAPVREPVAAPAPAAKPPAKPVAKGPVPTGPAVADAEKEIKSLFRDEYAKRTAADRVALARKLLKAGEETTDDAAMQFVTLREARDLAATGGDFDTALAAIRRMGQRFILDVPDLEAAAFASASRAVDTEEGEPVFAAGLKLAERLADDDELDAALKMMASLEDLARRLKSAEHVRTVQARAKEIRAQLAEWNRVRPSAEKLKETPDDAEASQALGKYYAVARKWAAALPLLAKSSGGLKEAAAKELGKPADAAALADAGDLWAAAAEKESGALKTALQERAREFYEKALPGLTGLAKARVEKRLQSVSEVASASGDWIDLLRIANPATHVVTGKWTRRGNDLEVAAGEGHDLLEFPRGAQGSYDLQAVFTVKEGSRHEPAIMLPVGNAQTALMLDGWAGPCVSGLASVDGVAPNGTGNPTTFTPPKGVAGVTLPGSPITVTVRVRIEGAGAQVQADVNGRKIVDWKGKQASLSVWSGWPVKSKSFGIGACQTEVAWHAVRVRLFDPSDRTPKKK